MTNTQRLDHVEDELETVKRLLISTASYAESANRRLDELTIKQDRTQSHLDELTIKQDRTQSHLDELTIKQDRTQSHLDELTIKQDRTQSHLDQLEVRIDRVGAKVDQLSDRVDSFITYTQRLFTKAGSEIEETKARTERLEALMLKLDRNFEEQKSQFQEFQLTTGAALERIDRVLDYLLRQQGGNLNPPS
ncbi:6-aminohexanoate hydrolase [Nostoc sp. ChiSLP03a]|uniref:6-aminohexanoate hydrolase n=1 Tax=Nostoc sp. ChiSLP03a TaxID=3075380 RepID=UPI002AD36702|nr:6-aminohexanoate hydrolase [Nostoc sp. ChiSLP03a]MDZ8214591.1 6-aminohexanoate hydrolase [Nostoc sp. ChiSLP03a]